jgi:hypothetical protein
MLELFDIGIRYISCLSVAFDLATTTDFLKSTGFPAVAKYGLDFQLLI